MRAAYCADMVFRGTDPMRVNEEVCAGKAVLLIGIVAEGNGIGQGCSLRLFLLETGLSHCEPLTSANDPIVWGQTR